MHENFNHNLAQSKAIYSGSSASERGDNLLDEDISDEKAGTILDKKGFKKKQFKNEILSDDEFLSLSMSI
jgi:hypothetical protein